MYKSSVLKSLSKNIPDNQGKIYLRSKKMQSSKGLDILTLGPSVSPKMMGPMYANAIINKIKCLFIRPSLVGKCSIFSNLSTSLFKIS